MHNSQLFSTFVGDNVFTNKMNKQLTIFTATYNRAYILPRLYESLCQQQCQDFVWLIIDDGSVDNTRHLVDDWKEEHLLEIRYHYQNNSGKMRAHNYAVTLCDTPLFFCLDSDDYLTSDTVVGDILNYWQQHESTLSQPDVCGLLTYRKMEPDMNGTFVQDLQLCTIYDVYHRGYRGEVSPVFKTSVIKQFPFPNVADEKFIIEDIIYDRLREHYKFLLFPYYSQLCEYHKEGYTRNRLKHLFNNPKGYRLYFDQLITHRRHHLPYHVQMYIACSMLAFDGQLLSQSSNKWLVLMFLPVGIVRFFRLKYQRYA